VLIGEGSPLGLKAKANVDVNVKDVRGPMQIHDATGVCLADRRCASRDRDAAAAVVP
jgi:hypothetical protein